MGDLDQSRMMPFAAAGDPVVRKVFRRLMWFLFLLLIVSFVDRINIGFAALTMNKELGLNAAMYGMSVTVFYVAYFVCEVPSNLALAKLGARLWIARIMVTWGIASAATMFAAGEWSLYGLRAVVGAAEAGFLPGILLYLTYWYPGDYRARANSLFLMGIPATVAFNSTLSGLILQMNGFLGLSGWRWLFLLEGLPAAVLGIVCFFFLDDGPAKAKWLSGEEKAHLQARLDHDRTTEESGHPRRGIWRQLGSVNVVLLSVAYFGLVSSLNANSTWTPQLMREIAPHASFALIGLLTAAPAVVTVAAMPLYGLSSDRSHERLWHFRIAAVGAALGWLLVVSSGNPEFCYLGLALVSVGSFCALMTFWTLPASAAVLSPEARPAGIALINCIGIGGGSAIGPLVIGYLKDLTGSFASGMLYVVAMLFMAVICVTLLTAAARVSPRVASARGA
jgi:MFS transporter, ACS family, 4-hydroxyphenylacetate permease